MQITWTNCADEMPHDENIKIIAIFIPSGRRMIHYGCILNGVLKLLHPSSEYKWKWTSFTKDKWEYLNK